MSTQKHIIIFSHGFGVRKDDRGLLTDIAGALPEAEPVLFDYFDVDENKKTLTACPFSSQIRKLNRVIEEAKQSDPGAIIDLIGHSQGTVIPALAKPEGIRKAILLAPVFDLNLEHTLARHRSKPGAVIDLDGITILPPLDGLTRLIPAEYWRERANTKPIKEYNAFAKSTEIIIILANQDEVLPKTDIKDLDPGIGLIALDGAHNFDGPAREPLINTIRKYLI